VGHDPSLSNHLLLMFHAGQAGVRLVLQAREDMNLAYCTTIYSFAKGARQFVRYVIAFTAPVSHILFLPMLEGNDERCEHA
jgi:hypothetical protein